MMRFQHWLAAPLLLSAILTAPLAQAHGDVYFEFAPDAWASMRHVVSAGETPYQLFEPSSALLLTAYDLWVDNTGDAGLVTLTLADDEGTTLRTNTITLPSLPAVPGGNKLHINLSSDLLLTAGRQYSIKIDSSLLGFGLYYADRIAFLGHNEATRGTYSYGAARLGQAVQPFSFKFGLRKTPASGAATTDTDTGLVGAPPATTTTPPPVTQQISISNARIISTTGTTVTIAWSTDIAADSRASVRSQLDPLYVVASGYDPTLELEHTLTIGGLIPKVNYFADVFSSQGSELVLTTYTLSFKTGSAAATAPTTPSATPPAATPQTPTTPSSPTAPSPSTPAASQPATSPNATTGAPQGSSSPSVPQITIGEGDADGALISWPSPAPGEPEPTRYRVDVFNSNRNLVRSIQVPAGTTSKDVPKLEPGIHHAIVYAERGGVFSKVAPAVTFLLQSNDMGLIWKIVLLTILWIVGIGGYFVWKFKKEKTVLPPEEGYDPNR